MATCDVDIYSSPPNTPLKLCPLSHVGGRHWAVLVHALSNCLLGYLIKGIGCFCLRVCLDDHVFYIARGGARRHKTQAMSWPKGCSLR